MSGRALHVLALGAALVLGGGLAHAQEDGKDPKKEEPKSGRRKFARDQGSCAELEKHVREVLAELGKRFPDMPFSAPKQATPAATPKRGGGGLAPPKTPGGEQPKGPARSPEEVEKDALLKTFRSWRPTKEALGDVLSVEGVMEIGKKVYKQGKRTFGGDDPRVIAETLGLHPSMTEVKVFNASQEELYTMELGTVAAIEFASGLRGMSPYLKPRYQFYVVVLDRPEAEKKKNPPPAGKLDPADCRLQLFVKSGKGWTYLGRIWRLEQDAPGKKAGK